MPSILRNNVVAPKVIQPGGGGSTFPQLGTALREGAAADMALLPYTSAERYNSFLNSGAALSGLSFDQPLPAPAIGFPVELRQIRGEERVRTYNAACDGHVLAGPVGWPGQRPPVGSVSLDA